MAWKCCSLVLVVIATTAVAGPIFLRNDFACPATVQALAALGAVPVGKSVGLQNAWELEASLGQRGAAWLPTRKPTEVYHDSESSDSTSGALKRVGELVRQTEQEAPITAYVFRGQPEVTQFFRVVGDLLNIAEGHQTPFGWKDQGRVLYFYLLATEGILGAGVVGLGAWFNFMPAIVGGSIGMVAGALAYHQARLTRLREDFSSTTVFDRIADRASESDPSWAYYGSTFRRPWLARSPTFRRIDREGVIPLGQSVALDLFLKVDREPELTIWVRP